MRLPLRTGKNRKKVFDGASEGAAPKPFTVTAGEELILVTRFSADGVTGQFQLEREGKSMLGVTCN